MGADPVAELDARRRHALARMAQVTGQAGVCAVTKSGQPFPAAKFHEGAVAALGDVRRVLAAQTSADEALAQAVQRWSALRERSAQRDQDWQAYAAGGLEELQDLAVSWELAPPPPGAANATN